MRTAEAILNGRDVVAARAREDVNQEELAKALRLFDSTLSDIENGRIELSQADYQRLLDKIREMVEEKAAQAAQEPASA